MTLTPRADRAWQRMVQMFGDKLTVLHPRGMPPAMAQIIDRVDNETVIRGLGEMGEMRQPPRVAEVERVLSSSPSTVMKPHRMPEETAYLMAI